MPDIYEMNTFDLRASFPSVRVRRYEEATMSYRGALVLVATFCALPVAAFNAPAPLAHCIISSSSSSSHSRTPYPLCADQLPTEPIRAPRRIKGDKPRNWDKGLSESKKRRIVRGGSLGPKGKAAVAARPQGRANQLRELQRLTITGGTARGRRPKAAVGRHVAPPAQDARRGGALGRHRRLGLRWRPRRQGRRLGEEGAGRRDVGRHPNVRAHLWRRSLSGPPRCA